MKDYCEVTNQTTSQKIRLNLAERNEWLRIKSNHVTIKVGGQYYDLTIEDYNKYEKAKKSYDNILSKGKFKSADLVGKDGKRPVYFSMVDQETGEERIEELFMTEQRFQEYIQPLMAAQEPKETGKVSKAAEKVQEKQDPKKQHSVGVILNGIFSKVIGKNQSGEKSR